MDNSAAATADRRIALAGAVRRQSADEGGQAALRPRRLRGIGGPEEEASRARRFRGGGGRSVKAIVADAAPEGVEGALDLEAVVAGADPAAHRRHDPARPRRAHLHVGEHRLPQGRDDDPPEHGLRGGEHRPVPAPGPRRAHPRPAASRLRLRASTSAVSPCSAAAPRPRALVRLPAQIVKRVEEEEATVFPRPTVYATLLSMRRTWMDFELPSVRRVTNTAACRRPSTASWPGSSRTRSSSPCTASPSASASATWSRSLAEKPTGREGDPGHETMVLREDFRTRSRRRACSTSAARTSWSATGERPSMSAEMIVDGLPRASGCSAPVIHFTVDDDGPLLRRAERRHHQDAGEKAEPYRGRGTPSSTSRVSRRRQS